MKDQEKVKERVGKDMVIRCNWRKINDVALFQIKNYQEPSFPSLFSHFPFQRALSLKSPTQNGEVIFLLKEKKN